MQGLQVVCLISGGKDSAFSILHCLANGHEVVALANLYPPRDADETQPEDVDSYMYQTIGHAVIPLYEKVFGLPLYRQEITGSAINQEKCYGPSAAASEDETESLTSLLLRVKAHHPDVSAVSTGAILSDYQRTRVESVAIRLGLASLSYLWQYPHLPPYSQTSLLEDMAVVGQDSRIIKVASGGLDSSFLWENVADPGTMNRLSKASEHFGSADDGAVLGEGGEYETLAIGGPTPLWKGRIVVQPGRREVIPGDAGSASIRIFTASVEMYDTKNRDHSHPRIPPLLESRFDAILTNLQATTAIPGQLAEVANGHVDPPGETCVENRPRFGDGHNSDMHGLILLKSITGDGSNAEEQMRSIMNQTDQLLQNRGGSFSDIVYTSIILRDMKDFLAVNAVYGAYFSRPNPPARVTIASAAVLPIDKSIMLSFTITQSPHAISRKGLHVQSWSYWAPANIGPYSQAISIPLGICPTPETDALIYISGQIPLLPASMELATCPHGKVDDTFLLQCVLSLQHAVRVGRVMQIRSYLSTVAFIVANSTESARSRSNVVHIVWEAFHHNQEELASAVTADSCEDPSFDVWNLKHGPAKHPYHYDGPHADETSRAKSQLEAPPLYVVRVDALPRSASVEWVTYGVTKEGNVSFTTPHLEHLLEMFSGNIVSSSRRRHA